MADLVFNLALFRPNDMSIDCAGYSIEGGRSITGAPPAESDISGGGFWTVRYGKIMLGGADRHRAWLQLVAHLKSSANRLIVPIQADIVTPPSLTTETEGTWALYATTVQIKVNSGAVAEGTIFEINHSTKGPRSYIVYKIDSLVSGIATVGIVPPIRQACNDATAMNWYRPRVAMRADKKPGWDPYGNWAGEQTLTLIESRV